MKLRDETWSPGNVEVDFQGPHRIEIASTEGIRIAQEVERVDPYPSNPAPAYELTDRGWPIYTCDITGGKYALPPGSAVPRLGIWTEGDDAPWVYDVHPRLVRLGPAAIKEALYMKVSGSDISDVVWRLTQLLRLAQSASHEIAVSWPEINPAGERGRPGYEEVGTPDFVDWIEEQEDAAEVAEGVDHE